MARAVPGEAVRSAAPAGSGGRAVHGPCRGDIHLYEMTRIGDSDDLDHGPRRQSATGRSGARRRSEGRSRSPHSRRGLRGGVGCTEGRPCWLPDILGDGSESISDGSESFATRSEVEEKTAPASRELAAF